MTKSLHILIGAFLLVLLLAVGGLWLAADRVLDGVVRPWLSARAAAELNAEVGFERLTYADGRLVLTGLSLERHDVFHVTVVAIEVRFSWTGLLQRRISEVLIRQPQLVWSAAGDDDSPAEPVALPQAPPLRIDAWRVENGGAELHWGSRRFLVDQLAAEGGLALQFPVAISARIGAEPGVTMRLTGQGHWQEGLALTLAELSWNDKNLLANPLVIKADAALANGVRLGLERLDDTAAAGLLTALGEPLPWPAELHWQLTAPTIELRLADGRLAAQLQTGPGAIHMSGRHWPWQSSRLQLEGSAAHLELAGTIVLAGSSSLALEGTWANQQLSGSWDITVDNLTGLLQSLGITMPTAALAPRELKLHGRVEADRDTVTISSARLTTKLGILAALATDLHGEWRDARLTFACDHLVVTSRDGGDPLAEGALTLVWDPVVTDWQGKWSLKVADATRLAQAGGFTPGAGAPNLQALTLSGGLQWRDGRLRLPKVTLTGQLSGAQVSGRLRGQLNLDRQPGGELAVTLDPLTLEVIEYQAEDGMAGVVGGTLRLQGQVDLNGDKVAFNLTGQAGAAEALLQSWYGNLAALPLHLSVRGSWLGGRRRLELAAAALDLAGLIKVSGSGSTASGELDLKAKVDVPRLQGSFEETVKALAGELLPGLEKLSLGGRLQLEGAIRARGDLWSLDLTLEPEDLHVAWDKIAQIDGLHGRVPVHLQKGGPAADELVEAAFLKWSGLQGGLLKSGAGRLDLQAAPNRWRLLQPLELSAAGGVVRLTALQLDLPNLVPQLRASLDVTNVELMQISRFLDWPEMGGLLSASLAEIYIAGDEVRTIGDASMRAFGGDFTIGNMRVEAPFSRFPTYHADVDFSGIDLHQLTNTFAFGEMNGIADGYIHELRLFDGTPSAFKARLETRLEGTRNISVKAIRNLNTLSQGGLSAALSQGIYQFIDFYHYRKIGILCWLQNDHFHLEGSGRADSNQYLVYGGLLPPRIDVVVSSPTISFKEMVRRLKRIERAEH